MSHTRINVIIQEIIKNATTVLDAVNVLKIELPFFNEETLYNMIIDILKNNKQFTLVDNFKGDDSDDNSINEETENLMESFEHKEVLQLRETLMSDDEKHNETDQALSLTGYK